ncbi:MAG: dTDP-4-dehydrorhamnose 3,5-epimerase family protein [Deltaproteobacteria bacterium]|nr:dTDP-4-dehydrorhamnose 3,5-epimerase family protein [Deltaproteobacteria bacterium]
MIFPSEPKIITGGLAVDERGEVGFVNDFDPAGVKRFYTVANHRVGQIRAWLAHRYEAKFIFAVQGAALVGAVKIEDWEHPAKDALIHRHVLSAHQPAIFHIPAGYANGSMSLTPDAKLLYFSTATLNESRADDIRYDPRYWDIWSPVNLGTSFSF